MIFGNSKSFRVPYGYIAERIWSNWEVIWEDVEDGYQGHAYFILCDRDKYYPWYCIGGWSYGTCTGCCAYNGKAEHEIMKEFLNNARFYYGEEQFLEALKDENAINNSELWDFNLDKTKYYDVVEIVKKYMESQK